MKIVKSNHVTATEKKHLKAFLKSGMVDAKVNTKQYSIISRIPQGDKYLYKIRITTPKRNDYGDRIYDTQTIEALN